MKNLGTAYDYIIDNPDTIIDIPEICKLHSMLCTGTPIQGGLFRNTSKVLELYRVAGGLGGDGVFVFLFVGTLVKHDWTIATLNQQPIHNQARGAFVKIIKWL